MSKSLASCNLSSMFWCLFVDRSAVVLQLSVAALPEVTSLARTVLAEQRKLP